ncbi:hypothetical protein D3C83_156640 [compost metagenome]
MMVPMASPSLINGTAVIDRCPAARPIRLIASLTSAASVSSMKTSRRSSIARAEALTCGSSGNG